MGVKWGFPVEFWAVIVGSNVRSEYITVVG